MEKLEQLYEGKAKKIYRTDEEVVNALFATGGNIKKTAKLLKLNAVKSLRARINKDPELKEALSNMKRNMDLQSKYMERIEQLKKELNAVENTQYFEEEEARKKAELEAKMKEFQKAQEEQKPQEAEKK